MRLSVLLLSLLWAGSATALEFECVARLACVSNLDDGRAECQETELRHGLRVGSEVGDEVVMIPEDADAFYEFTRLPGHAGLRVQAAGGALEEGQGAGVLTVFDTLDFVVTRHTQVVLDQAADERRAIAVTIHGTCKETR